MVTALSEAVLAVMTWPEPEVWRVPPMMLVPGERVSRDPLLMLTVELLRLKSPAAKVSPPVPVASRLAALLLVNPEASGSMVSAEAASARMVPSLIMLPTLLRMLPVPRMVCPAALVTVLPSVLMMATVGWLRTISPVPVMVWLPSKVVMLEEELA